MIVALGCENNSLNFFMWQAQGIIRAARTTMQPGVASVATNFKVVSQVPTSTW